MTHSKRYIIEDMKVIIAIVVFLFALFAFLALPHKTHGAIVVKTPPPYGYTFIPVSSTTLSTAKSTITTTKKLTNKEKREIKKLKAALRAFK